MIVELVVSFFLLAGATFALLGSIGLARFPDFYMRLHGPTKSTTLGVGGMILASFAYFTTRGAGVSLHEILVILFLFATAPISATLMAKVALHLEIPARSDPPEDDDDATTGG